MPHAGGFVVGTRRGERFCRIRADPVRTPELDPWSAQPTQPDAIPERPAADQSANQGVRSITASLRSESIFGGPRTALFWSLVGRAVIEDLCACDNTFSLQEARVPDVHLDSDDVDILVGGEEFRIPCEIVLRQEASGPEVIFRLFGAPLQVGMRVLLGSVSRFSLRFVKAAFQSDVCCVGGGAGADRVLEFKPFRDPVIVGSHEKLAYVRFDLINFPNFNPGRSEDWLDVAGAEWCVDIRPPRDSPDAEAAQSPFYSVTHSCTVRRANSSAFSSSTATELLGILQDALSFAAGRWVGTAFVAGFDSDGDVGWKCWGVGRLHPRISEDGTWFDRHHGDSLPGVLCGALDLSRDSQRYNSFHAAVYWYVRSGADRGGVDGGLILLNTSLERLGWQRFVVEGTVCPDGRFEGLKKGAQLRCLLKYCRIPVAIPPKLAELAREAATRSWEDGPRAVVETRNLLVHPTGNDHLPWHEAWMLARWYVELVLLRMLNFTGDYLNRTRARAAGDVERVPWG